MQNHSGRNARHLNAYFSGQHPDLGRSKWIDRIYREGKGLGKNLILKNSDFEILQRLSV